MIPIKGYATFHPLKHCMVGAGFDQKIFENLKLHPKILSPLKRISEETEEDYQKLIKILKENNVIVHRCDISQTKTPLNKILRPPMNPRDHFAVIGKKIYIHGYSQGYSNILKKIDRKDTIFFPTHKEYKTPVSTCRIMRLGKDLIWGHDPKDGDPSKFIDIMKKDGFRVKLVEANYHSDGCYTIPKPGVMLSLYDWKKYSDIFPNWDIMYLPDQSWAKTHPFLKIKKKVGGRWWLKGEEHNDQLIEFVNTWLNDWVGYVEETVFDVNMLSIDECTVICNYNKEVFDFFKKHKIQVIPFNFRHRYFWDGGIHCITQDLYREGEMEDYFG